jgi:phosphohistidine phosphatase
MAEGYELILVRHAKAEERDPVAWPDDGLRPLTARGREKMREAADGLRRLLPEVDWIISSPFARAAATAEILHRRLEPELPVEECRELCPGGDFKQLLEFLRRRADCRRVMLVGHETDLSRLAAALIGSAAADAFGFRKGGCCLIEFAARPELGRGRLVWWMTPALMRALR